ncbi:MAG: hypothetical protein RLY30_1673 [Pseudomonadota bacterium]|jgi:hypothetical protein
MTTKIKWNRLSIDWGHFATLTIILGWTGWYFLDARSVSRDPENLLVLGPVVFLTLILGSIALFQALYADRLPEKLQPEKLTRGELGRIVSLIGSFVLFVFALPTLGFDGAGAVYIGLSMALFGERRPWVLIGFPVVSMVLLMVLFQLLVPYDVPSILMPKF